MTFEQFRATRSSCSDLGAALSDARWEDDPIPAKGNLYCGALFIEAVQPHWPETAKARGCWYLIIGREDWLTDDLESLERILYEYAIAEGFSHD